MQDTCNSWLWHQIDDTNWPRKSGHLDNQDTYNWSQGVHNTLLAPLWLRLGWEWHHRSALTDDVSENWITSSSMCANRSICTTKMKLYPCWDTYSYNKVNGSSYSRYATLMTAGVFHGQWCACILLVVSNNYIIM